MLKKVSAFYNYEQIDELLSLGVDVNKITKIFTLYTPLSYEIVQFLLFRGKPKIFIYATNSLMKINLHEQQAYKFVQFSD